MGQMPFYAFAGTIGFFLLLSLFQRRRAGTIQQYFWGNSELPKWSVTNLLTSNSFSLNGLLYQVWLGYLIGWWSLLVQIVWCSSFLIIAFRADRLSEIVHQGTMHGILAERFGKRAGQLAAVASIIGFTGLIGWEAVVGATFLKEVGHLGPALYVVLPVLLALAAAFYTRNGGLQGNGALNMVQNIFKGLVLIGSAIYLLSLTNGGFSTLSNAPAVTKSLGETIAALGGVGLIANFAFSALWQAVDMSFWQSLAGLKDENPSSGTQKKTVILVSALLVLIFPGLVGTVIGIALSSFPVTSIAGAVTSITAAAPTDSNILNFFVNKLSSGAVAQTLLICSFAAAMLSTIDGYTLAASQAFTWDLWFPGTVKQLLGREGKDLENSSDEDKMVISLSRLIIFFVGAGGAMVMIYLVFARDVGLFNLVYGVVVGQMSLSGPVLVALFGRRNFRTANGSAPIVVSLLAGFVALCLGFSGNQDALTWAPLVTILISIGLSLVVYVRAGKTKAVAV